MPPTVETGHESALTRLRRITTDLGRRYALAMAQTVCLVVSAADRARLEAIVADRNRPQKHVARARIVLLSAERLDVATVARRAGISRAGGLALAAALRRGGRRRPAARQDAEARQGAPGRRDGAPGGGADLRRAARRGHPLDRPRHGRGGRGLAALRAAHLGGPQARAAPGAHLQALARPRLHRQAGGYRRPLHGPAAHAVVLSVDEKSQIQASTAPSPGCRSSPASAATMTHDYIRHGTTTLFAALNVLDGTVLGRCMQRHRHQEFLRFLNAVEAAVPAGKLVHAIMDNYGTHKHPRCGPGSRATRAGPSTSPRPRPRGSTRSRASSRR